MSQFAFLEGEWPEIAPAAKRAESLARSDARAACFYARRSIELAVTWLYRNDPALRLPYQDHLSALIHESTFRDLVGPVVLTKLKLLKDLGNLAVHTTKPVGERDAIGAVRELFHVSYWLARTYGRRSRPEPGLSFRADLLPAPQNLAQIQAEELRRKAEQLLAERDTQLAELMSGRASQDAELQRLRAEVAAIRHSNTALPDTHDYSEAQTRTAFIDLLLKEAGWALDQPRDREYPVIGMPSTSGDGFVDYVLWGNDGKPLAVVEAKRTTADARVGQQQAKLYADCLETQYGQRPVIYYTNGYEHWLWDDHTHPPRAVQGFHKRAELELMVQRRESRQPLANQRVDPEIAGRPYQTRAIRRITESFEHDRNRRALLVMATGAGKTRTVIALSDLLLRAGWAKRVLFLADRVALVNQAAKEFRKHLPSVTTVNLVADKATEGRVFVSTYPTMMRLIDESVDGQRRFSVGHFDLVVIDEAHRSVYRKYGAIFDYFDSLLVGLTATPRGEVDRNTYRLFHLEPGVPTDVYDIEDAVRDGYLVPPRAVSVPLQFQRQGIRKYADLSEEEKEQWDALDWPDEEDGKERESVDSEEVNRWLFNTDTVDKALKHLMTNGLMVDDGERLAKTIVFAKNQRHAEFIEERFNLHYPHLKGQFARIITFKVKYAQSLIDDFSKPNDPPHIAVSVDMLDTGIDVPEVANLVFFKVVRSKTKFWQMVGRGTRLRPDLFGPGKDKKQFFIFDFCGNLEYFGLDPQSADASIAHSLSERLFSARIDLIAALDEMFATRTGDAALGSASDLRDALAEHLRGQVAGMSEDNFLVRPHLRLVERYREPDAWNQLGHDDDVHTLGKLPTAVVDKDVAAKQFDGLMLKLQLASVIGCKGIPLLEQAWPLKEKTQKAVFAELGLWDWFRGFMRLRNKLLQATEPLLGLASIPTVLVALPLIEDLQTAEWWFGVNAPMLEDVRKRLRSLMSLVEAPERKVVYSDFIDDIGDGVEIALPGFTDAVDYTRFRAKAQQFLKAHENHLTIRRLRHNEPLTALDLEELEHMLVEAGVGTAAELHRAMEESKGLGLFVRSLVGMDRGAAKRAFSEFQVNRNLSSDQLEFINLIVDHLADVGQIEASALYSSPFTDLHTSGVAGIFDTASQAQIHSILRSVEQRAAA